MCSSDLVPDHLRGRTMSFYVLGILAGIPLGAFALGRLGDIFTMRVAVYTDAAVFALLIIVLVARGWLSDLDVSRIDDVTSEDSMSGDAR